MSIDLTPADREMLAGERGGAAAFAMRILVDMAGVMDADRLVDIASAHIDGCLYHGRAGLDFARRGHASRWRGAEARCCDAEPRRSFANAACLRRPALRPE